MSIDARTVTGSPTTAHPAVRGAKRVAWIALTVFLAAFAVFESAKYGFATTAAAITFFVLPDLTMFIGVKEAATQAAAGAPHQPGRLQPRAVPFYNAMHRAWVPLLILVAYSLGPIVWPPLFTAGLGWLTHIALDRAAGYGLRTPEGFRKHV
jgi:uncharacterized protein DUF4260